MKHDEAQASGAVRVVAGLFLCVLLVVPPLLIPQVAQAAPPGVTVNRYFCYWMGEVSTTNTTWTDPEPSAGYYPLQLTFTPPSTANYLLIHCATLSNSSTSYQSSYRFLRDSTELCSCPFTPREVGDYMPFYWHHVMELTGGTEYTFKMQFKTSNAGGTAYLRAGHILIIQVGDYHTAYEASESNTTSETYVDKTTLTFTPSSAGDYLVLGSSHMAMDSVTRSFYTQLSHNGTSQGEVCRELTAANEYRAFTIMRVITFSSAQQTLKIQYKTENASEAAYIKEARITAIRLSDLGVDDNSVDIDGPETTTSETYVDVPSATITFTPSPNQQGDYLVMGFFLFNGSATNRKAYARLDLDGTPHGEMAFRPDDTKDYLPFICLHKQSVSPGSHTFKLQYKTEASSMTVECQNARLLLIKVNTLQSYSDAGVTEVATFDLTNHTVNIYGCYYEYKYETQAAMPYKVAYYDGGTAHDGVDGALVMVDAINSNYNRSISSVCECTSYPSASYGTWHAVAYRADTGDAAPAATYTPNDSNSTMEVEFTVEQSAIPEFPTVIAGIIVVGMCFGIYYWMRRRKLANVKA